MTRTKEKQEVTNLGLEMVRLTLRISMSKRLYKSALKSKDKGQIEKVKKNLIKLFYQRLKLEKEFKFYSQYFYNFKLGVFLGIGVVLNYLI